MMTDNDALEISQLYLYPIKSLGGIPVGEAWLEKRGFRHDRRLMLVDPQGHFYTQRTLPRMALLQPEIRASDLLVRHRQFPDQSVTLPWLPGPECPRMTVQIWEDTVEAAVYPSTINDWFSRQLDRSVYLVALPDDSHRPVDPAYAETTDEVSFADGFPYLIATEASLADLNRRLKTPVPMLRFRPNIVLSGPWAPWDEDHWLGFRLGRHSFRSTKPCGRCEVVTIDPQTAVRSGEPLRTLSGFRQKGHHILFGLNACWAQEPKPAVLRIGDAFDLTDRRPAQT